MQYGAALSPAVDIRAGESGLAGLVAYTGGLVPALLERPDMETIQ